MARASRKMSCVEERLYESRAPEQQTNVSVLSLYRAEVHSPSNLDADSKGIQCARNQSRYTILATVLRMHSDVRHGMLVHHYMVFKGLESSLFLGSHLLHMYFRCSSNENGCALFASMCDQNVYSWNYLIQACSEQGEIQKPLVCFCRMQEEAVLPNKVTFLTMTKAHARFTVEVDFERLHARIQHTEFGQDIILGTALLKVYGECGRMKDAFYVFNALIARDVVLWTTMIRLYAEHKEIKEALYLFEQMQQEGVTPTLITFVSLLGACANHAAVEEGKLMHTHILVEGLESDVAVGNALVYMYGNCASLDDVCTVFDKMCIRNVVTWTSMITLYSQKGYGKVAHCLFDQMQSEAVLPNQFTFVGTIVACACIAVLEDGQRLHTRIRSSGGTDAIAGAALVNMYDKCGSLMEAEKVFACVSERDLVLWNAMIVAFAQNKKSKEAIELFERMQVEGLQPDKTTFSNIFAVCAECAQQAQGERVHAYIMENGLEVESIVGNSLIYMYAHCGEFDHARSMFNDLADRDVVSWTVMIAAYALYGQCETAFNLFYQMQQEGHLPDKVTYVSILNACGHSSSQAHYVHIHAQLEKSGYGKETLVQNALISLCGKWGNLVDAESIYSTMSERDVVTWNTVIGVYSRYGLTRKVFEVFEHMCNQGIEPDRVTFVSIMSACASHTLFAEGNCIHMWAADIGCESDNVLGTAILTMYGKCGSIEDARRCFNCMQERNVLTWNALMAVYAQHGQGKETISLFRQMQREKFVPDGLSYLAVLLACSHAGLADEGKKFFTSMVQEHGISPTSDHYGCLIDLFGRVGQLDEARNLIYSLHHHCVNVSPTTALGASKLEDEEVTCKVSLEGAHRGEGVEWHAFEPNSDNPIYHVILSNFHSALIRHKESMKNTNFEILSNFHL